MATLYDFAFTTFINLLKTQQGLLEKAEAYAAEKGIDVSELLEARLAPDMWPASQQITISCLHASNAIVKLAGGEANNVPFGPASLQDCKSYLATAISSLEGVKAEPVNSRAEEIVEAYMGSFSVDMRAVDYATGYLLPNFYFHTTTLYDILRNKGAPLGKRDFLQVHIRPANKTA